LKIIIDQIRKDTQIKTIVYHKYGSPDVLELKEVEKRTAICDNSNSSALPPLIVTVVTSESMGRWSREQVVGSQKCYPGVTQNADLAL